MGNDRYDVVFDLVASGFQVPWLFVFGALCVVLASTVSAFRRRGTKSGAFSAALAAFVVVGASASYALQRADFERLRAAVLANQIEIVEGRVRDFYLGSSGGNVPGHFRIGDQRFFASSARMPNAAYNRWPRDLSDTCVRIEYVRNQLHPDHINAKRIVWLGIDRSGCASSN